MGFPSRKIKSVQEQHKVKLYKAWAYRQEHSAPSIIIYRASDGTPIAAAIQKERKQ